MEPLPQRDRHGQVPRKGSPVKLIHLLAVAFAKHCLLAGVDELGHLCGQEDAIARYEEARRG